MLTALCGAQLRLTIRFTPGCQYTLSDRLKNFLWGSIGYSILPFVLVDVLIPTMICDQLEKRWTWFYIFGDLAFCPPRGGFPLDLRCCRSQPRVRTKTWQKLSYRRPLMESVWGPVHPWWSLRGFDKPPQSNPSVIQGSWERHFALMGFARIKWLFWDGE